MAGEENELQGSKGLVAALIDVMGKYVRDHRLRTDEVLRGAVGFMGTVITLIAVEQGLSADQQSLLHVWVKEALGLLPTLPEAPDAD
jgi:hypothetical protein